MIFLRIFFWMSRATPDPQNHRPEKQRTVAHFSKDFRSGFFHNRYSPLHFLHKQCPIFQKGAHSTSEG